MLASATFNNYLRYTRVNKVKILDPLLAGIQVLLWIGLLKFNNISSDLVLQTAWLATQVL